MTRRSAAVIRCPTQPSSARPSPGRGSAATRSSSRSTTARAGPRAAGGSCATSVTTLPGRSTSVPYVGPLAAGRGDGGAGGVRPSGPRTTTRSPPRRSSSGSHDRSLCLLDARAPARWRGDGRAARPGRRAHPRRPERVLPPAASRRTRSTQPEVAAYCGSGVTAAVVVQKLVLAGREDARMYPGRSPSGAAASDYADRERSTRAMTTPYDRPSDPAKRAAPRSPTAPTAPPPARC